MSGDGNIDIAKRGYEAFAAGDVRRAMIDLADDVEWITPGRSSISGSARGKQEVAAMWSRLAEKGFRTHPQHWLGDEERVVVLTEVTLDGETYDAADVLTFHAGKVVRFQSAADTALLERVFPQ